MTAAQFEAEILKLPRSVRARLAERLIGSLDEEQGSQTEIEEAWSQEADRRYQAFLEGNESAEPMDKLLKGLREEYGV